MKQLTRIEKAEIYASKIPFKMGFTHAMASRSFSDSLILKIEGQGKRGFGEAIVRDYVSGEIGKGADLLKNAKKIIARFLELLMEKGLKASCIRLVSAKGYENSIQFGSFQESEVIERVAIKSDKVDSKAEEFAKKGFTVEISKAETEEGYTQLILSKKVEIFKETELVPRWAWKRKTKHVLQEYICTKVKPHKAHVKLKSWGWTPSGIFASIALILSFVYNNPQRSVDLSLKLTLWIAVGVFFLITLGYHSIAGKYEIEVCEPHIALGILKANMHLLTAEKDAQTIATLKDELFRLKASRQIDSMSEGEKMSAILIDEMLAFIDNLERESK